MITVEDKKSQELKECMEEYKNSEHPESHLIAILHKAQSLYGYIDRKVMDEISVVMNIPTAHIWGVVTFYHYFNLKPIGKHVISVCLGTACYVKGINKILDAIKSELKIEIGETTEDKMFTLQGARCLGACGQAPVIMIDNKIYGKLTKQKAVEILKSYCKKG